MMTITRNTKNGKYYNTWFEGNKTFTQDIRTGKTQTLNSDYAQGVLRPGSAEAARNYANG
jgi:hypothetical protein